MQEPELDLSELDEILAQWKKDREAALACVKEAQEELEKLQTRLDKLKPILEEI